MYLILMVGANFEVGRNPIPTSPLYRREAQTRSFCDDALPVPSSETKVGGSVSSEVDATTSKQSSGTTTRCLNTSSWLHS